MIISYLLGSIPWALIIGKLVKGIDIREHGSKNMGATNAFRVLGFKYGLLVFALDALKGGIVLFIMKYNFFNFDLGDFIGATGEMFTTHTGEKTIRADEFVFLIPYIDAKEP